MTTKFLNVDECSSWRRGASVVLMAFFTVLCSLSASASWSERVMLQNATCVGAPYWGWLSNVFNPGDKAPLFTYILDGGRDQVWFAQSPPGSTAGSVRSPMVFQSQIGNPTGQSLTGQRFLDIGTHSTADFVPAVQASPLSAMHPEAAYQQWDVEIAGGYFPYIYRVKNRGSAKCLTALGIPYQTGSVVQLACSASDMRQWWGFANTTGTQINFWWSMSIPKN